MEDVIIKVYDDNGNVVKECKATPAKIKFKTVRQLMKLLKIEEIKDTAELFSLVYDAWEELTYVLGGFFPEMTDADWDNMDVMDVIPVIVQIMQYVFSSIMTIPNDSKN